MKYGDTPVLLYTWLIPHAADDATINGDPYELLGMVWPNRRDKNEEDITHALEQMEEFHLIVWDKQERRVYFPTHSFYKYQTYIKEKNRRSNEQQRKTPQNTDEQRESLKIIEEQRESAENAVSLSLSLSPSLSLSHSPPEDQKSMRISLSDGAQSSTGNDAEDEQSPDVTAERSDEYTNAFLDFWDAYPRKTDKRRAWRVWKTRLKEKHAAQEMIQASLNYAAYCESHGTSAEFIKHPGTFLGPDKPFVEYIDGYTPSPPTNKASSIDDVLERARKSMGIGGDQFDPGTGV